MPIGKVEEVDRQFAVVSIERQDMCGECHACEVVGEVKKCTIKCQNTCDSQAGDLVEVDLEKSTFLKATSLMYGVPLAGLVIGLVLGYILLGGMQGVTREIGAVVLAIVGMGIGLGWLRKKDRSHHYDNLLPKIVKTINK